VTSYYVYYRVDPAQVPALRAQIERVIAAVEQATGVRGRWLRRRDQPQTYMEVYEDVADAQAFEALLARETAALGLERHVERFVCA
jgi:quinol monooxygenase YgiN